VADTFVYIDGFNFYYGALRGTSDKWLDYEALVRLLLPNDQIGKIRYFTANVKPLGPGDTSHQRQNAYLRAVATNPLIEITRGRFEYQTKWRALAEIQHPIRDLFRPHLRPVFVAKSMFDRAGRRRTGHHTLARVRVPEEKGTDVSLGAYLVYDALKGNCSKAVVLTNDSDLKDAISLVVSGGVPVGIVNPHHRQSTSTVLRKAATFEIRLRPTTLSNCQLPNTVVDGRGRQIHKPKEW